MSEPQKPFACLLPDCGMSFTNEDHLHVHTKKHDMVLQLGLEQKNAFVADQTPTPTRFIRNCEEVGLFQDLQNVTVNPFDEGFKRAMETKLVCAGSLSLEGDDALHTPQMVFPLIDGAAHYTGAAPRPHRSSVDDSSTAKEYETTTTTSKMTNQVTTISRVLGNNKDGHDKANTLEMATLKHTTDNGMVSYKSNTIKVHGNIEIRKDGTIDNAKVPVLVHTDNVGRDAGNMVTGDVLLANGWKLQLIESAPPIMSQKSLDFVVDSLTSETTHNETTSKHKNILLKRNHDYFMNVLRKANNDITNKSNTSTVNQIKIMPKPPKVTKNITKIKKPNIEPKTESGDYEVIIKLPDGKQVRMKAIDETKPDAKEVLRQSIVQKQEPKPPPIVNGNNTLVPTNVLQIPTGTLIPVTLVNQVGAPINTKTLNKIPIVNVAVKNKLPIPINYINKNVIVKKKRIIKRITKVSVPLKTVNIAPKINDPLGNIGISPPFTMDTPAVNMSNNVQDGDGVECILPDSGNKNDVAIRIGSEVTADSDSGDVRGEDSEGDEDCVILDTKDNGDSGKRRMLLDCRSAASKRYRERLKSAMQQQSEENRILREANRRLTAEKAVLKMLITEHMKRCPDADDIRRIQDRLKHFNSTVIK